MNRVAIPCAFIKLNANGFVYDASIQYDLNFEKHIMLKISRFHIDIYIDSKCIAFKTDSYVLTSFLTSECVCESFSNNNPTPTFQLH